MATIVPQKRSTPTLEPAETDPAHSPSASKQPPLDATLSTEPAVPAPTIQGFRVPKMFKGIKEWGPTEMGPMETTYLSTQFEVDDSSEYKEALLAMEGLVARSAYPTRQHIRQVLSLCFFPLLFKPPTRVSAFARATSSSSANTKPLLPSFDQDPFNLSHKKLREEAGKILDDLIATNGVETVCRSIKGYGLPKLETPSASSSKALEDPFQSSPVTSSSVAASTTQKSSRNPKMTSKGKGKAKSTSTDTKNDSDEDLDLSDSDDVLAISAKRIGKTENLWDFLAGTAAKKQRVWTREQPVLDGGWEILRSFVDGWEAEWEKKKIQAYGSDSSIQPLSFLRYFKPSATSSIARELSSKAFDVAFWPFTDSALPKDELESDDSESEIDDSDLFSDDDSDSDKKKGKGKLSAKGKGKKAEEEEVKFEGGLSLEEKKEVGIRLLCLIGECATVGHFDANAALGEFVQRIKALDHTTFPSFLELLSLHSPPSSPFLPRLLSAYLDSHSHPLSAVATLDIASLADLSSSTLASTSSSDNLTSPRKRALAASSSLSSLSSIPSDSQSQKQTQAVNPLPTQSDAEVEAEFWKTPNLESKEFLTLISRIPIEVPLPRDSTSTTAENGGGRRPKSSAVGSSDRAAKAAECHRLVKEVLVSLKVEESESKNLEQAERERSMNSIRDILQGVQEVVEQAKTKK
ncbi:hypothetical protein JCM5350_003788 [Sporobolomyces pararoseus]